MLRPKLISRIFGGIGNQLFSYAAARRLAIINDAELVLDNLSGFANDTKYQRYYQLDHFNIDCHKASARERLEPFSRLRRMSKRRLSLLLPFALRSYVVEEQVDFDSRLLDYKFQSTVYLEGYWQSENYFKDIEKTIRKDLVIKPPIDDVNLNIAKQVNGCKAVAVHVRFFNKHEIDGFNNAPADYYRRAIQLMDNHVPNAHYFIFSDKPESARARIHLPDDRVTFVSHNKGDENAYADLWLMTLCNHFIIANSSFSWWGAWLANQKGKKVIAPGFEKRNGEGSWGFDGLLPNDWIKL